MKKVASILLCALLMAFAFLPTVYADMAKAESIAYLGGMPIGIGLAEDGLIVTGFVDVITDEGAICPARDTEILTGDLLIAIDGIRIGGVSDFAALLQKSDGEVTLTMKRGENELNFVLTPVTDILTGLKKVGLTMKNGINGVGTMTFILPNTLKCGALGHGIVDADTGKLFLSDTGSIYRCQIDGVKPPESGKAGELIGRFVDRGHPIGVIDRCNAFGVYGVIQEDAFTDLQPIPIGSQGEVKTGDALIYSTIRGDTPKAYKIQIVKTATQKKAHEKSMLIRVIDEELLNETGGILQGMSGSPIVQNGKLVGAVTHVLVNESTLGYGLYIDWMLENAA